jgi:MFS family permease
MSISLLRPSKIPAWLAPLSIPVFRALWTTWLVANVCMYTNDVAAAWMMTSLTTSATLIALVQTAANLPVLMFGLPSGALADILNRKHFLVFTQLWLAINATLLFLSSAFNLLDPIFLLLLTFINGVGLAMRWPVYAAIVPDLVPRDTLHLALGLNSIAMNASRILGPLIAGLIIAWIGTEYVFALNMILSLAMTVIVLRWKNESYISTLPGERFFGAMRVGAQYIRQSKPMRAILARSFLFYMQSSSLLALLPIIAKSHFDGDANTFTLLLSCLGFGAIIVGSQLQYLRRKFSPQQMASYGIIFLSLSSAGLVLSPSLWYGAPIMILSGMSWFSVGNTLSTASQLSLPNWIRARGISFYQMSLMGGSALGAFVWGKITNLTDVTTGVIVGAIFGIIALALVRNHRIHGHESEDLTPVCPIERPHPSRDIDPQEGPVMISVEYHIHQEQAPQFRRLMAKTRRSRLKQGALSWSLFEDAEHAGKFLEYFVFETWADYLRRFDRFTADDLQMQEERHRFHIDSSPPKLTRRIATQLKQ